MTQQFDIVQELRDEEKSGKLYLTDTTFSSSGTSQKNDKDYFSKKNILNDIFNSISDGISVLSKDLEIVKVNKYMEQLYQNQLPFLGKKCYTVYQARKDICPWCPSLKAIESKTTQTAVVPYPSEKNPEGWLLLSSYPLIDDNNSVYGVIEHVKDITPQRKLEQELIKSKEKYEGLFNLNPEGILIVDKKGFATDINEAGLNLFGLSREQVIGKHFSSFKILRLRDIPKYSKLFIEIMLGKTKGPLLVELINHKTKKPIIAEVYLNLLKEKGDIIGLQVVSRDITKKIKSEQLLRESQQRYQDLFDHAADLIAVIDKKGNFVELNKKFEEESGYNKQEMIGKNIFTAGIITKISVIKIMPYFSKIIKGHDIPIFEIEGVTKQGNIIPYELRAVPIMKDHEVIALQAILRNITERKKAESAKASLLDDLNKTIIRLENAKNEITEKNMKLEQAQKRLTEVNLELEEKVKQRTQEIQQLLKQKDEFVNQLGHDLKNPINPLINLLPIIEKKLEHDAESKEMFEVINRNVRYMKNLVVKTIQLARLNSPSAKLSYEKISLFDEVDNVLQKNLMFFKEYNIDVENCIEKKFVVNVDRLRFEELFDNLLNNAVKYSPQGGIVCINASEEAGFIKVSIKDQGVGIDKNQLIHVFDEFFKADSSRHDFDSSGLGLPICKRIVEKHGGQIWVESDGPGKGCIVYFTLPKP